tara:strand:- start:34759 stop:35361 length:603 start_codon:yes stop_codon:yes gene_type:complete
MVITALAPAPTDSVQAETQALTVLLEEFDLDGRDAAKVDYLKNRYAGFNRKEAGTLAGVRISTVNKWLKLDPRVSRMDATLATGQRKEFRKEVLQEEWFRNFYLVLQRDAYVLKKVHGLLEEPYLEMTGNGQRIRKLGSPPMLKQDWDYYGQMRKMYTPDAWASIEKAISGPGTSFNISEFILNLGHTQQVNIQPSPVGD